MCLSDRKIMAILFSSVPLSVSNSTNPALLTDTIVLVGCVFISLEVVKLIFCSSKGYLDRYWHLPWILVTYFMFSNCSFQPVQHNCNVAADRTVPF